MFVDHYEVLQISPNADQETIHRVYRVQAQRFHPDNREYGNAEVFRRVRAAYEVLSDPVRRAAYDVEHRNLKQQAAARSKFEQSNQSHGLDTELKIRDEILNLLYRRRLAHPDQPSMSLRDLEDVLGVPRDKLEFSLWYLKESGYILRSDSARHSITIKGVESAEAARAQVSAGPRRIDSSVA